MEASSNESKLENAPSKETLAREKAVSATSKTSDRQSLSSITAARLDANGVLYSSKSSSQDKRGFQVRSEEHESETTSSPWRPSFLRFAPLAGLAALLLAIILLLVSYTILAVSDGDAVENWKFEPNVYLAIFAAISNKAVAFAAIQGMVVTFWLRALQGTTLGQLHRDWAYGHYVYRAIASGRKFNLLALACISATLVAVDGPLFQRASTVDASVPMSAVNLQVNVVHEIPAYQTGSTIPGMIHSAPLNAAPFLRSLLKESTPGRLSHSITGCPQKCSARVRGPALALDSCTSNVKHMDFGKPLTPEETRIFNGGLGMPPRNRTLFAVAFGIEGSTQEKLVIQTWLAHSPGNSSCTTYVNITTCRYVSAIAEYPVTVEDDVVKFSSAQSHPDIVQRANNTALTNETINRYRLTNSQGFTRTTLAGIAFAGLVQFDAKEFLMPYGSDVMEQYNSVTQPLSLFTFRNLVENSNKHNCIPKYTDPRDEIVAALNEWMFNVGAHFGSVSNKTEIERYLDPGVSFGSNVTGVVTGPVSVFRTDLVYFAGAAILELFTICVILLTYWGWWKLGRESSLSPLELANAFNSPLLRGVSYHLSGKEIANLEGQRPVQYGILKDKAACVSTSRHFDTTVGVADKARVHPLSGKRLSLRECYLHLRTKAGATSNVQLQQR